MRTFLIKLLLLSVLILVIASLSQLAITIRIKGKTTNGHDNFTAIRNQKNDLVFLGSSRCTDHFVPRIFNENLGITSMNLGVNGHADLPIFLLRLKYYLKYNPPPKYVVLNFDPLCVPGPLDFKGNIHLNGKHFFSRYAFAAEEDNKLLTTYFNYNFAEKYVPLYAILRYKMLSSCITMADGATWLRNGYMKNDGYLDTSVLDMKKIGNIDGYKEFGQMYDSIKTQLLYFKTYCSENKINLICLQSPVFKIVHYKESFGLTGQMCKELDIRFIDANDPSLINYPVNFLDPLHLNTIGVQKFCNYLCKNQEFLAAINWKTN